MNLDKPMKVLLLIIIFAFSPFYILCQERTSFELSISKSALVRSPATPSQPG